MKIYFMGVCGTAMGNAALLARAAGHEILGADSGVYPPMSTVLAEAGIALHEGYDPKRLTQLAPDLVVIGNAMSRGNPEVEFLLDSRSIPFISLPALLNEFVMRKRQNIVVCGTHGKTTTTALTSFLLRENGRDPGYLIGGVPLDPPTGNHLGALSDPFVIEGDEYDSAFFDKRSKFIHYAPSIAVLNNLEFDHADIFRDLKDVMRTFEHLTRIVPGRGCIVMNGDDPNLAQLPTCSWTRTLRVGLGEKNDVRIENFVETPAGSSFRLTWRGQPWAELSWALPGIYNARNAAMAATAAGLSQQLQKAAGTLVRTEDLDPRGISLAPLQRFRGVKRRQEILVETKPLTVIEDFGHHPTALAETLRSFRNRFPGYRISAVFEPRSNTARTKALQPEFMASLALADEVFVGAVNRAEKLKQDERFDVDAVLSFLREKGLGAYTAPSNAELLTLLQGRSLQALSAEKPQLVVFFSNGSFDGIIARFAAAAKQALAQS